MTESMRERMARAIHPEAFENPEEHGTYPDAINAMWRSSAVAKVDTILDVLAEPSEETLDAAARLNVEAAPAKWLWRAMITAIRNGG